MLAPKGFTQIVQKDGYIAARMAAHKKAGILRFTLPMALLIAAVVAGSVAVMLEDSSVGYLVTGVAMLVVATVVAVGWFWLLPEMLKSRAENEFTVYEAVYGTATVTFSSDDMVVAGESFSRRVDYAKTRLCIETPARFVVVTDDNSVVILERTCFDDISATDAFLRDVFARWYVRMR